MMIGNDYVIAATCSNWSTTPLSVGLFASEREYRVRFETGCRGCTAEAFRRMHPEHSAKAREQSCSISRKACTMLRQKANQLTHVPRTTSKQNNAGDRAHRDLRCQMPVTIRPRHLTSRWLSRV